MSNNNNDQLFKEAFDNQKLHLDHDELWSKIEPQLPEKKKKRALIWWGALASFAVMSLAIFYFSESDIGSNSTLNKAQLSHLSKESLKQINDSRPKDAVTASLSTAQLSNTENHTYTNKTKHVSNQFLVNSAPEHEGSSLSTAEHLYPTGLTVVNNKDQGFVKMTPINSMSSFGGEAFSGLGSRMSSLIPLNTLKRPESKLVLINTTAAKQAKWSIYLQSGVSRSINRWEALGSDNIDFVKGWQAREKPLVNYNFELGVSTQSMSPLRMSLGLRYKKKWSRIRMSNSTQDIIQGNEPAEIYIKSVGDTIVQGLAQETRVTDYRAQWYNSNTSLDLGLKLAYTIQKGRWAWSPSLGIYANVLQHHHGVIPNEDFNQLIKVKAENETQYFTKRGGINYYTSLEASYRMQSKWALFVQASFEYDPKNGLSKAMNVKRFSHDYGMTVGLRYFGAR